MSKVWRSTKKGVPEQLKDVLLWDGRRVFLGWVAGDGWYDATRPDDYQETPTHWMPLPDPPVDAQ